MRHIVLFPNPTKDPGLTVTQKVARFLLDHGMTPWLDRSFGTDLEGTAECYGDFPKEAELLLVIGGDGSMLDASVLALAHGIALLGINLGKLGYLSEVEPSDLSILANLATGNYTLEEKMLLSAVRIKNGVAEEVSSRLAVNDVVISHESYLGIADLKLSCGGEVVSYRADGLIFATPAGSTAYSLSAGGPICAHDVDAVLVTPICAHTLLGRPILFSAKEELSAENAGTEPMHISIDGRHFTDLLPGESCKVTRAEKPITFLTFRRGNLFSALFRKMNKLSGAE